MKNSSKTESIKEIMTKADDLLKRIDTETFNTMEYVRRIQFEKESRNLKKLKLSLQNKNGNVGKPETNSSGDGMHEAIGDISKAITNLGDYLTR